MGNREEQLQQWKERRASTAGAPLSTVDVNSLNHQVPKPAQAVKLSQPAAGKGVFASRIPRQSLAANENVQPNFKTSALGLPPKPAAAVPSYLAQTQSSRQRAEQHRKPVLTAEDKQDMQNQYDLLQDRLDSLKRESLRPSIVGDAAGASAAAPKPAALTEPAASTEMLPATRNSSIGFAAKQFSSTQRDSMALSDQMQPGSQPQFEPASGQFETKSLTALAEELFHDKSFQELCDKGLNATLQRTKDGATAESRIQELAALVKLLRRCLNQLMARTRTFIDNGIKFEKEAGQQVESVQLASESATKALEAELANAKRETAQAAAAHKSAAASWQGELDYHKGEASRIRRELERIESERDRAREEARRAEQARQELEGNVKGLKKETGQQLRELQMNRGEAMRALQDAREAAERREQLLQEDLQKMQVRAEYAESRIVVADSELSSLRKALQEQEGKLRETEAKLTTLRDEHNQLKLDFKAQLGVHAEVVAESSRILSDYEDLQERCSQMVTDLEDRQTQLAGTAQQLQAAQQGQQADHARWEGRYNSLQADRNLLAEREAGLQEEKAQLKAALGNALEQKAEVEEALHRALHEQHHLQHEMDVLKGTEARLISEAERLTSSLEASQRSLAAEQESKAAICQEAAIKAARLAHLEGEMEALQGVMGVGDQSEMVSQLVTRVAKLETAVAEAELTRRQLHNQLVEIRGNIRVFCRIRPAASSVVSCLPDGVSVRLEAEGVKDSSFTFDHVFDQQSSQADVFQQVSELVQSALDGYKVCLFSYGQTGAGKTHTMQGTRAAAGQGIIPRAVGKILECVAKLQEQGWQYELQASFIEVYNETLRDLLADTKGRDAGRITDQNAIKHGAAGGHTIVVGAVREPVESAEGAAGLVKRAAAARAVEATAMNAVSSRSHSVFMLYITGKHEATGACVHGALNLVDLAGSERLNRSEASGQRQKEACSINKSLSSLGDVFQALSAKTPHVPYRNSKLTHLLQPCLGGDGKTLMFVNINPEAASANETLCSLRFAAKVNACETGARGGAKRHTSQAAELPSSSSAGASAGSTAQANRRQSLSGAPLGPGIKRKAPLPPAPMPQRSLKPRIG